MHEKQRGTEDFWCLFSAVNEESPRYIDINMNLYDVVVTTEVSISIDISINVGIRSWKQVENLAFILVVDLGYKDLCCWALRYDSPTSDIPSASLIYSLMASDVCRAWRYCIRMHGYRNKLSAFNTGVWLQGKN